MPTPAPPATAQTSAQLLALGQQIRARRKALQVTAVAAAEAAGMSRVTLHRIEKGEPSVTLGAYLNAMNALGLTFGLIQPPAPVDNCIPLRIHLPDYPQLQQIAWQIQPDATLTPLEAWSIYQRNWRHVDVARLSPAERQLVVVLQIGLGAGVTLV